MVFPLVLAFPLRPRHVDGLAHDLGLAIGVLTAPLRAGDLLGQ